MTKTVKILQFSVLFIGFIIMFSGCKSEKLVDGTESKEAVLTVRETEYLFANGLKITYKGFKKYKDYTPYSAPREGYIIIQLDFTAKNTDNSAKYISADDFICKADFKPTKRYLFSKNELNGYVKAGETVLGSLYFEVPENANCIVVEYTADFWSGEKAVIEMYLPHEEANS